MLKNRVLIEFKMTKDQSFSVETRSMVLEIYHTGRPTATSYLFWQCIKNVFLMKYF